MLGRLRLGALGATWRQNRVRQVDPRNGGVRSLRIEKRDDPVSEADFAVDTHLRTSLLAARPDYGWVSEETEDDPARFEARHVFIVDPIDGTRAFVAGEPTWAHSLAITEEGRVTAACVYLPVRDKLYLADLGGGATLNGQFV